MRPSRSLSVRVNEQSGTADANLPERETDCFSSQTTKLHLEHSTEMQTNVETSSSIKNVLSAADRYALRAWMHGDENRKNRAAMEAVLQAEIVAIREAARQEYLALYEAHLRQQRIGQKAT